MPEVGSSEDWLGNGEENNMLEPTGNKGARGLRRG
jgi:hypothetical protein